jgi:D-glycero-D-manno-heptose 1,7-bisphosphate phosphatase
MKPAVFLDRDGTIIEDRGHLSSIGEVIFFPETIVSLQNIQKQFELFIVTHQPGVSRGLLTMNDVDKVNSYIVKVLREHGISIRETYVCPHERSERCGCIKPMPYFLHQAANNYAIDLERSYVIGDHPHDVELARNAGANGIYVLTGHGEKHYDQLSQDSIVLKNIEKAAQYIMRNM